MKLNLHEKEPLITKGVNVPTSLYRLKEIKIRGQPWFLTFTWGILFLTSIFISIILISIGVPTIPSIVIPGVFISAIAITKIRTRKQVLKVYSHIFMIIRIIRHESTFKKYRLSLDDLKKWIPIESIENTGLVRFKNQTSMIPIMLDPPRISATDLYSYNSKILNIINTLHGGFSYQFYAISSKDKTNHLANSAKSILNENQELPIADHMYSILEHSLKSEIKKDVPDWKYILFVYFPQTKSIEKAEKMKNSLVSSLSIELQRAKILANVVDNRSNCITLLRMILTGKD